MNVSFGSLHCLSLCEDVNLAALPVRYKPKLYRGIRALGEASRDILHCLLLLFMPDFNNM